MFDPDDTEGDNVLIRSRKVGGHRSGQIAPGQEGAGAQLDRETRQRSAPRRSRLDSSESIALHSRLLSIYRYELDRQARNRREMAMDEDFYDHIQWSASQIAHLHERGQDALVFNVIQTTVNWVLGSQRRAPVDYKVLPRRKDGSDAATRKDELLRHLRDENDSPLQTALAYADAVKAGVGWLETGEGDPADGPIVFDRFESWRNMLWDSRSRQHDMNDARYICRVKWLDQDMAQALWPDRRALLSESSERRIRMR